MNAQDRFRDAVAEARTLAAAAVAVRKVQRKTQAQVEVQHESSREDPTEQSQPIKPALIAEEKAVAALPQSETCTLTAPVTCEVSGE